MFNAAQIDAPTADRRLTPLPPRHPSAALLWARDAPSGKELDSLDARMREAALREGFRVVPDAA
jgi:hypothetical protein